MLMLEKLQYCGFDRKIIQKKHFAEKSERFWKDEIFKLPGR